MTYQSLGEYLDCLMRQLAEAGERGRAVEAERDKAIVERDALAAIVRAVAERHGCTPAVEWTKANAVKP